LWELSGVSHSKKGRKRRFSEKNATRTIVQSRGTFEGLFACLPQHQSSPHLVQSRLGSPQKSAEAARLRDMKNMVYKTPKKLQLKMIAAEVCAGEKLNIERN
jgi:hypothetical protein